MANETYFPQVTVNAQNNLLSSQSLSGGASVSQTLDLTGVGGTGTGTASGNFSADIQVKNAGGGTVATTNGCQVSVYRGFGTTPTWDTVPVLQFTIPTTASTTALQSFHLETGRYQITLTNLDGTNAITVGLTTTVEVAIVSSP